MIVFVCFLMWLRSVWSQSRHFCLCICAWFFWHANFDGECWWMDAVIIFCIPHVSKLPFGTNLSCFIRLQTLLLLQCRLKSLKLPAAVKLVLILFDSWVAASDWSFIFCFIGGLKWYFASSAVERMVQPPSKTNLDPPVVSLYLICELYMVFLAYFEMRSNWMVCESWNTTLFVNVFLSQQVESPNRKCQGLSCGIQFFLFHWGSEMVFCIISCWKNGLTPK